MREYIKKIQSKTESARKQILVGSLVVAMSLVGVIWVSSLGYKFSKGNSVPIEETVKPFALFGKTISDTYKNVSASVGSISLPKKEAEIKTPDKVIDLIPVEYTN